MGNPHFLSGRKRLLACIAACLLLALQWATALAGETGPIAGSDPSRVNSPNDHGVTVINGPNFRLLTYEGSAADRLVGPSTAASSADKDLQAAVLNSATRRIDASGLELNPQPTAAMGDKRCVYYGQSFNGVPIENAAVCGVIGANRTVGFLSARLYTDITAPTVPTLTPQDVVRLLPENITQAAPTLVLHLNSSHALVLAYRVRVETDNPPATKLMYFDAGDGNLLQSLDISLYGPQPPDTGVLRTTVNGQIDTRWNDFDSYTHRGFMPGGEWDIWMQLPDPGPQRPPIEAAASYTVLPFGHSYFADSVGHFTYVTTAPVNSTFRFLYRIGNDIVKYKTYWRINPSTGDYEFRDIADTTGFYYKGTRTTAINLYHDWYPWSQDSCGHHELSASASTLDNGVCYYDKDLNCVYQMRAMQRWYSTWIGGFLWRRVSVENRHPGLDSYGLVGAYTASEHKIRFSNSAGVRTYLHEFAHAVFNLNFTELFFPGYYYEIFPDEGQADYYSATFSNQPPVDRGAGALYTPPQDQAGDSLGTLAPREDHAFGSVLANSWWDLRSMLGTAHQDSLTFYSLFTFPRTCGEVMRAALIYDDNNGNLADGTPHFSQIVDAFDNHYLGPYLPLVFLKGDSSEYGDTIAFGPTSPTHPVYHSKRPTLWTVPSQSLKLSTLDTYPFDSLKWDFGDGSATVVQTQRFGYFHSVGYSCFEGVPHTYVDCGTYNVVARAYHPWGVRVDTLKVEVRSQANCPNYVCGDVNHDGLVNSADVTYLVNYLTGGGPAPNPMASGDVNCSGFVDLSDLSWLVSYTTSGSPVPCSSCPSGKPAIPLAPTSPATLVSERRDGATVFSVQCANDLMAVRLHLRAINATSAPSVEPGRVHVAANTTNSETILCMYADGVLTKGSNSPTVITSIPGQYEVVSAEVCDANLTTFAAALALGAGTAVTPTAFALHDNYPNPFNPTTVISFDVPKACSYTLDVFNTLGQKVTSVSGAAQPGVMSIVWDGAKRSSGVYYYRLTAGDFSQTRKMLLLK